MSNNILIHISMFLIKSYPARLITSVIAISLVMIGAMINMTECTTIDQSSLNTSTNVSLSYNCTVADPLTCTANIITMAKCCLVAIK